MHELMSELQDRWRGMFADLAAGADLPPARRLRAEGLMEAAVLLGVASEEQLVSAMDDCYRSAFGVAIAEHFGGDWREYHPFPEIPAMGLRAPVYPSTAD
jgi:hypothetical protein